MIPPPWETKKGCICFWCQAVRVGRLLVMPMCSECGNKRCPKGTDHNLQCTGSNEPGQPGSVYTDTLLGI